MAAFALAIILLPGAALVLLFRRVLKPKGRYEDHVTFQNHIPLRGIDIGAVMDDIQAKRAAAGLPPHWLGAVRGTPTAVDETQGTPSPTMQTSATSIGQPKSQDALDSHRTGPPSAGAHDGYTLPSDAEPSQTHLSWAEQQIAEATKAALDAAQARQLELDRFSEEQEDNAANGRNLIGGHAGPLYPYGYYPRHTSRQPRQVELLVAAQHRGLSRSAMLRLITTGQVPGVKRDGRWYVIE